MVKDEQILGMNSQISNLAQQIDKSRKEQIENNKNMKELIELRGYYKFANSDV